jgi:hypothetical protein
MLCLSGLSHLNDSDAPSMVTNQHFLSFSRCYFFIIPGIKTLTWGV